MVCGVATLNAEAVHCFSIQPGRYIQAEEQWMEGKHYICLTVSTSPHHLVLWSPMGLMYQPPMRDVSLCPPHFHIWSILKLNPGLCTENPVTKKQLDHISTPTHCSSSSSLPHSPTKWYLNVSQNVRTASKCSTAKPQKCLSNKIQAN